MLARYIIRRLLTVIPILLLASAGVFVMQAFLPGDLAVTLAGQDANKAEIASIRKTLNLNEPLWHRYYHLARAPTPGQPRHFVFHPGQGQHDDRTAWLVTLSLVVGALLVAAIVSPIVALWPLASKTDGSIG